VYPGSSSSWWPDRPSRLAGARRQHQTVPPHLSFPLLCPSPLAPHPLLLPAAVCGPVPPHLMLRLPYPLISSSAYLPPHLVLRLPRLMHRPCS